MRIGYASLRKHLSSTLTRRSAPSAIYTMKHFLACTSYQHERRILKLGREHDPCPITCFPPFNSTNYCRTLLESRMKQIFNL